MSRVVRYYTPYGSCDTGRMGQRHKGQVRTYIQPSCLCVPSPLQPPPYIFFLSSSYVSIFTARPLAAHTHKDKKLCRRKNLCIKRRTKRRRVCACVCKYERERGGHFFMWACLRIHRPPIWETLCDENGPGREDTMGANRGQKSDRSDRKVPRAAA